MTIFPPHLVAFIKFAWVDQWAGKRVAARGDRFSIWLHQPMRRDFDDRSCTKGDGFLICIADRRASRERWFRLAGIPGVEGVLEIETSCRAARSHIVIILFWNRQIVVSGMGDVLALVFFLLLQTLTEKILNPFSSETENVFVIVCQLASFWNELQFPGYRGKQGQEEKTKGTRFGDTLRAFFIYFFIF